MLIDGLTLSEGSVNSNLVITNVTLAQQAALTNLNVGEVVYVNDGLVQELQTWNGTTWVAVGASASVAWNDILNKPTLFSGSYADLTNKPTIPTVPTLATVATSGSYADLSNTPSIPTVPTAVSAFTNDSGYQTSANVASSIQAVVGAAPAALDTLVEIATQLAADETAAAALTTAVSLKAPLASPTFTGVASAPTAAAGTNTTQLATTAFVLANAAPVASPTFTGVASAPTAAAGTNTTQLATTAFVTTSLASKADLSVVMNNQTAAYTTVAADNGKQINITTGGVTLGSSVHAAGAVFSVYNQSASAQNISFSGVTFYKAGTSTAATSPISLSARGVASILFVTASEAIISGNI